MCLSIEQVIFIVHNVFNKSRNDSRFLNLWPHVQIIPGFSIRFPYWKHEKTFNNNSDYSRIIFLKGFSYNPRRWSAWYKNKGIRSDICILSRANVKINEVLSWIVLAAQPSGNKQTNKNIWSPEVMSVDHMVWK